MKTTLRRSTLSHFEPLRESRSFWVICSAKPIGKLADGRQFFMTISVVPSGDEYHALYLCSADGEFEEAIIDDFGPPGITRVETQ